MNKERTFLITGLFTLALIIMVVETGMIHFRSKPLVAQYKVDGVQLIHDQYKTEENRLTDSEVKDISNYLLSLKPNIKQENISRIENL